MSDGQPFGTRQSMSLGKKSAIGLGGAALASGGKKLRDYVSGQRNLQKQWEFATSVHAHNEGISHHYQMERMQADHSMQMERMGAGHEHTMAQIGKQGSVDRQNVSHTGKVGRQNLEHAAGVAQSMPEHNVSMSTGSSGEVNFSANKPAPPAPEESASPAKPPTTRTSARGMSGSRGASRQTGVTTPRKARKFKSGGGAEV